MITKLIKNKYSNVVVSVDDEDADILARSWWIQFKEANFRSTYFKVKRSYSKAERQSGAVGKCANLHREIWEKHFGPVPEGYDVDHIDYNTANNQKSNLRLLPKSKNIARREVKVQTRRRNKTLGLTKKKSKQMTAAQREA